MTARKYLLLAAKVGVSGLLLWFVLTRVDGADIVARLRATDVRWLLPMLALAPLTILLSAWRWRLLSLGLLGFGEAVRYTWIGLFFGSILPGVVGGDVAKGLSLAARDPRARDSRLPVSIIVDKIVGLWTLIALFILAALLLLATQPQLLAGMRGAVWLAALIGVGGLIGGVGLCHPKGATVLSSIVNRLPFAPVRRIAAKIAAAIASYGGQGRTLATAAALSVVIHVLNALGFWLAMHSLAVPATPLFAAVFYPMLSVLLALPVSISGVGVRDVFSAAMFAAFGLSPEAGAASWLQLGLSLPVALVGGLIQLWEVVARKKP